MATLHSAVYSQVDRIAKLAEQLTEDNYASSADFAEMAERVTEMRDIADGLIGIYEGLAEVLSVADEA